MPEIGGHAGGVPGSALGAVDYPTDMVRVAILVVIAGGSGHTNQIDQELRELGFAWSGRGPIYHQLHFLSERGLLRTSRCRHDDGGRSHLLYQLTGSGEQALAAWIADLESLRAKLTEWSQRCGIEPS